MVILPCPFSRPCSSARNDAQDEQTAQNRGVSSIGQAEPGTDPVNSPSRSEHRQKERDGDCRGQYKRQHGPNQDDERGGANVFLSFRLVSSGNEGIKPNQQPLADNRYDTGFKHNNPYQTMCSARTDVKEAHECHWLGVPTLAGAVCLNPSAYFGFGWA
jgi:hypothetical protein